MTVAPLGDGGQPSADERPAAEPTRNGDPREGDPKEAKRQEAETIGDRLASESERLRQDASYARSYQVRFGDEAQVRGGVAGRDQFNIYVATAERHGLLTRQIADVELRRIRQVYVRPSTHLRAVEILRHHNVVVLRGERQTGKRTAALRLLQAAGCSRVIELDNDLDLERLCAFEFEADTGYLVDKLPKEVAARLSPFRLGVLQANLGEQAKLVLTLDAPHRLPDEAFRDYGTDWQSPDDRRQLLQRHVRPAAKADELLRDRQVTALLAERIAPVDVELLASLLRGGMGPEVAAEEFRSQRAQRRVLDWFQRHEGRRARALFVVLAVLDGSSYRVVLDQGSSLLRRWAPEDDQTSPQVPPPRLRLADAYARLVHTWEDGRRSSEPAEQAQLDDPAMRWWILEHAWRELDDLREPLLAWLAELATDQNEHPEVRQRAAVATGRLCERDFQHVLHTVLKPWVDEADPSRAGLAREAVTTTLGVATAWTDGHRLRPFVVRTLHSWGAADAPSSRRQAAAAVYGGLLGLRFPYGSLRRLHRLAAKGDFGVFWITRQSMANLFDGGSVADVLVLDPVPDYYGLVLAELLWWTADKASTSDPYQGLVLFLSLARQFRERAGPVMLLLSADDRYRRMVGVLLLRSLNDRRVRTEALRVLRNWVQAADRDPLLESAVVGLIEEMATLDDHGRQRLLAYLPLWAGGGRGSPTARRCLDVLGGA